MDFSGFEKLSLLDYDTHLTATLFYAGCDFRCPFCHNSSLVIHPERAPKIPFEEIYSYLKKRAGILEAVCFSGGEPTMMPDLEEKIRAVKDLGYLIKLDSNGSRPEVLRHLIDEGLLDYVAMDIKNSPEKYALTAGMGNFPLSKVKESVSLLLEGKVDFEFRTTAIEEYHTLHDFEEIGAWIKGAKRYFIQRYIDSENCIAHGLHMLPQEKALEAKALLEKYVGEVSLRGYDLSER